MLSSFAVTKQVRELLPFVPNGAEIINLSSTGAVWLLGDPGVGSGNGTPLQPLASMTKTGSGPLYGVLDAAAVDPSSTVLITDDLANYSDPVALAAAVAAEIAAKGVPDTLLTTVVTSGQVIPSGPPDQFVTWDISPYASILISVTGMNGIDVPTLAQSSPIVGVVDDISLGGSSAPLFPGGVPIEWNVVGSVLSIDYNGAVPLTITIIGKNRAYTKRLSMHQFDSQGWITSVNFGAAGTFDFPIGTNLFCGLVKARFSVTGNTTQARLLLQTVLGTFVVIDAVELGASGAATPVVTKELAIPVGYYKMSVQITTFVAAGNATLQLLPV